MAAVECVCTHNQMQNGSAYCTIAEAPCPAGKGGVSKCALYEPCKAEENTAQASVYELRADVAKASDKNKEPVMPCFYNDEGAPYIQSDIDEMLGIVPKKNEPVDMHEEYLRQRMSCCKTIEEYHRSEGMQSLAFADDKKREYLIYSEALDDYMKWREGDDGKR